MTRITATLADGKTFEVLALEFQETRDELQIVMIPKDGFGFMTWTIKKTINVTGNLVSPL